MNSLIIDGVCTIKILNKDYETEFKDIEKTFPEYKDTATTFVLGGFGAYGNPSSFHNPLVKKLREFMETMPFIEVNPKNPAYREMIARV
jgi:hypothetical protein